MKTIRIFQMSSIPIPNEATELITLIARIGRHPRNLIDKVHVVDKIRYFLKSRVIFFTFDCQSPRYSGLNIEWHWRLGCHDRGILSVSGNLTRGARTEVLRILRQPEQQRFRCSKSPKLMYTLPLNR